MRIVALVESLTHVCCRYRLAAFQAALVDAGYTLELTAFPKSAFARLALYHSLRSTDAVILQRKLLPRAELALLRRSARKLIFDFDDAVWLRDSYSPKGFDSPRRHRRLRAIVSAADAVVAGNRTLQSEAVNCGGGDRATVIPTCVDPAQYPLACHTAADSLRLVWVGSGSTLRGLERFRDTLEAVGRAVPGLSLRLVCDRFLSLDGLPVEAVPWAEGGEAEAIASADIGIGWVPDDPWSRGKCGLKILQYQAAGLPVVANPVGVQAEFVRNGITGFQAETAEQWIEAIRCLAREPKLRRNMGWHGRIAVREKYSPAVGGRSWVELLDRLLRPSAGRIPA